MIRQRYFFRVAWCFFVALLIYGCVGKKPDDDVALIKQLLAKFERGVNQRSEVVLDSITQDKKQNIASRLLDSLSFGKKLEGARIAKKSFVMVKDSAEVRLRLRLEYATDEQGPNQIEKSLRLFLNKKRGKWKIQRFSMVSKEKQ
ncbi:MAG: hypothetical protein KAW02_03745 [candidate division Zixibacteria bacterium]|nr:hypothetical protein [candidate division Zixibacteria bacterium]